MHRSSRVISAGSIKMRLSPWKLICRESFVQMSTDTKVCTDIGRHFARFAAISRFIQ